MKHSHSILLTFSTILLGGAALGAQNLSTNFNAVTLTALAHTDAVTPANNGNRNVAITPVWAASGSLGLTALTGTLTMGDFTWANIGSGVVFTTLDGGAFAGAGFNSVARLTATVEVDRSNFQFGNGNPGASTAVAPANVAVFNLLFTVTGQLNNPEVSFRAGTSATNGEWNINNVANNGSFEVVVSPVTIDGNNGTVNFNDSLSLGGVTGIGAGAGPLLTASAATVLPEGTYLLQIRLSGQGGQRAAIDDLTMIPEPSTYAAIFGLLALGFVAWRRRKAC